MALRGTDILTGLYTSGYLIAFGARELAYAREQGIPVSLIAINIPNFKVLIADGPDQSATLKKIVDFLTRTAGKNSVISRTASNEISVLLPGISSIKAAGIAYKIKRMLTSKFTRALPAGDLSIGVASESGESAEINNLIKNARKAMEASRKSGSLQIN